MRRLAIILAVVVATPVSAQDVISDTLDWRGYYPLHMGNEWHYTETPSFGIPIPSYYRYRILGDTVASGRNYFIQGEEYFDWDMALVRQRRSYLRYDSAGTVVSVIEISADSGSVKDWRGQHPLRAAFGVAVDSVRDGIFVSGSYGGTWNFDGRAYPVEAIKNFSPYPSGVGSHYTYTYGIGLTRTVVWDGPVIALAYAAVDGQYFGAPVITVNSDAAAVIPQSSLLTYPNPAHSRATMVFWTKKYSAIEIDVSDLLGRKVQTLTDGYFFPGRHTVSLNASSLSAGVYFVRLRAGDWLETHSLVVAR